MRPAPGSFLWLLANEMRLSWRGLIARSGAKPWVLILVVAILLAGMTAGGLAIGVALRNFGDTDAAAVIAAFAMLAMFSLMLSQTLMRTVDVLYQRGDLDLLLSSPVSPGRVLAVRGLAMTGTLLTTFSMFLGPLVVAASITGGFGWLGTLVAIAALALLATAVGLQIGMGLFIWLGPRRTKTIAQVLAAFIGAAIFVGSQAYNLVGETTGGLWRAVMRLALRDDLTLTAAAAWPIRAMRGEALPLASLAAFAILAFWLSVSVLGRRFATDAAAAKGAAMGPARPSTRIHGAFARGPFTATVRKDLRLTVRDAALLSQVLLRVLYLLPIAAVLVKSSAGGQSLLIPGAAAALAIASGQIAGSLAWINVSAEEAPDLLVCAPTRISAIRNAKLAAALIPLGVMLVIPIGALATISPWIAFVSALGAIAAALASGLINIWHQKPSKRSDFRRRRGSSWYATLAEFVVSGFIGGAVGVAALGSWWALLPAAVAGLLLFLLRRSDAQIAAVLRAA